MKYHPLNGYIIIAQDSEISYPESATVLSQGLIISIPENVADLKVGDQVIYVSGNGWIENGIKHQLTMPEYIFAVCQPTIQ